MSDQVEPIDDALAAAILDKLVEDPTLPLMERWKLHPHGAGLMVFVERMAGIMSTRRPALELDAMLREYSGAIASSLGAWSRRREGDNDAQGMEAGVQLGIIVGLMLAARYVAMTQAMVQDFAGEPPDRVH